MSEPPPLDPFNQSGLPPVDGVALPAKRKPPTAVLIATALAPAIVLSVVCIVGAADFMPEEAWLLCGLLALCAAPFYCLIWTIYYENRVAAGPNFIHGMAILFMVVVVNAFLAFGGCVFAFTQWP